MALIGSSIDPRMFVQDYSGFAQAANTEAAGMASLGQTVGNGIADYSKQKKDLSSKVKSAEMILKAAEMSNPGDKNFFSGLRNELSNPGLSPTDAAAMADQVGAAVAMHIGTSRYNQEMGMKQQELASNISLNNSRIAQANAKEGDKWDVITVPSGDGSMMIERNPRTGETRNIQEPGSQSGLVETGFGYPGDTTPDSNSKVGIGARVSDAEAARIRNGERTPNKMQDGDIAFSPDVKNHLESQGVKIGDVVTVKRADGSTHSGRWMDVTRGDLTGRVDIYSPGGLRKTDGSKIVGIQLGDVNATNTAIAAAAAGQPTAQVSTGTADYVAQQQPAQRPFGYKPNITPEMVLKAKTEADKTALEMKQAELGIQKTQNEITNSETAKVATATEKEAARVMAISKAEDMKKTVGNLAKHPGFTNLFGSNVGLSSTWFSGSDASGAKAIYDQIKGKLFLDGISQMKGMGALSDAEGAKVTAAASSLSNLQSESDAKKSIQEIITHLNGTISTLKNGASEATPATAQGGRFERANILKTLGQ